MSGVILVRHAMPEVVPGTSSKLWGLSEASREDCVLLAHVLPTGTTSIWSSDERKARETADVIGLRLGLPVQVESRFAEVDRPQVWDRDYREVAAGYLGGVAEAGWESPGAVVKRFQEGIEAATSASDGDIIVVSHGLAMTLWLGQKSDIEPVGWWRELTLPDAWRFDAKTRELAHLWMGGARGDQESV
jgi:broad specificity phosphatase PhoE